MTGPLTIDFERGDIEVVPCDPDLQIIRQRVVDPIIELVG